MEFIPPVTDAFKGLSYVGHAPDSSLPTLPALTDYSLTVDNDIYNLRRTRDDLGDSCAFERIHNRWQG